MKKSSNESRVEPPATKEEKTIFGIKVTAKDLDEEKAKDGSYERVVSTIRKVNLEEFRKLGWEISSKVLDTHHTDKEGNPFTLRKVLINFDDIKARKRYSLWLRLSNRCKLEPGDIIDFTDSIIVDLYSAKHDHTIKNVIFCKKMVIPTSGEILF